MNRILNSKENFQYKELSFSIMNSCKVQEYFSDLVPSNVTVESVLNNGYYSFKQLNPMTASYFSDAAVLNSLKESCIEKTGLNMLGTGLSCTPTVTFLN